MEEKKIIKMEDTENDIIYRFEEMKESIEQTICNINNIKNQSEKLINLIKENDKENIFENFVNDTEKQNENYLNQINELTIKNSELEKFIDMYKNNENNKEIIKLLCKIIGLFK